MRVLVCGGRDYNDWPKVREVLDVLATRYSKFYTPKGNWLPSDFVIIAGGARGADELGAQWAAVNWCDYKEFKADWALHGKAAGPIRNQQMLDKGKPDLVVAFPGGKGTADMVRRAKAAKVKVIEVSS
jgi:hypothetical protein